MIIKFPLNSQNPVTFRPEYTLQVNESVSLKIEQEREINCGFGQCDWRLKIYINQNKVYNEVNSLAKIYTNVRCFLSTHNYPPAQVIVKQSVYRPLLEEIPVRPSNLIGEIPYMWPPYHGYMAFNIKRTSDEIFGNMNILNVIRLGNSNFICLFFMRIKSKVGFNFDNTRIYDEVIFFP